MDYRSFKSRSMVAGTLVLAIGVIAFAAIAPTQADTIRQESSSTSSHKRAANVIPQDGSVLFTWYDIGSPIGANPINSRPDYANPDSDNVIRLIDPNGCGNSGISNFVCGQENDICAMVYVFDDDQEMGECCGCLVTPDQLLTLSVRQLVDNWDLATQNNSQGTIVMVASGINNPGVGLTSNGCANGQNDACHDGCDPTSPALTSSATTLTGSILHDNLIAGTVGLTESPLFGQGGGEPVNNAYLVAQCGVLAGNGSHRTGFCACDVGAPG